MTSILFKGIILNESSFVLTVLTTKKEEDNICACGLMMFVEAEMYLTLLCSLGNTHASLILPFSFQIIPSLLLELCYRISSVFIVFPF